MNEILDVATEVELEAYEGPEFHDHLQRARIAAGGQSTAVVFGLVTIFSTVIVAIGALGITALIWLSAGPTSIVTGPAPVVVPVHVVVVVCVHMLADAMT